MQEDNGDFKIAPGVLELIVGLSATEVKGVTGLSGGVIGSISDWLGGGPTKGVRISVEDSKADIDLHLVVEYGLVLRDVARAVQENVKKAVESMTDCKVSAVNVIVDSLASDSQPKGT
jgi:uncharacterized alkaline shock family protein YloU